MNMIDMMDSLDLMIEIIDARNMMDMITTYK